MKINKNILLGTVIAATNISIYALVENQPQNTEKMTPMVQLGGYYSSAYGFIGHSQFSNFLSPKNAASFLLDFGKEEFRMDLTWAYAPTSNQRFKLSGQQLSQDNNYDFASGEEGQFVGQTALGGEYEYLFTHPVTRAIHVEGYYFSANDGDLDNVTYTTSTGTFLDERGITGADGAGVSAGPRFSLWGGGELKFGLGYSGVKFDPQYEPPKNSEGFGGNAIFSQELSRYLAFEGAIEAWQPYQEYAVGLTWMPYQKGSKRFGMKLEGRHVSSDVLPVSQENIIGLSLVYQWDGNAVFSGSDSCERTDASCGLLAWSTKSAARLPSVFVQKDELVMPE